MVATRRPARRSESEAESHVPAAGAELTSAKGSSSVRTTRSRRKINSHSEVIPDSQSEKMKESETKSGFVLETQKTLIRSKTLSLADSVAELQADGDISEAESNCSSVSGLQTPMFIRITRRRKIMIPCQPESAAKNRQSKKTIPNEGSKCQEDDEVSEAESCSSTISGVRPLNTPRKTRSQQTKASILPVCETQAEEVSDAASWCSSVSTEPSARVKRITRSMGVKSQGATTLQSERKSEVVVGDEKLPECVIKSLPIVISDSEQPTKSDLETEKVSFFSAQNNEHPSPCKIKCHSESVMSSDPKQILSSSPKNIEREYIQKSPKKEWPKDKAHESVDNTVVKVGKSKRASISITKQISDDVYEVEESTENMYDQSLEKTQKVTEKPSPVKNTDIFPQNHRSLEQSDMSPRQTTPNKRKNNTEPPKTGTRRATQSCFHHTEEVIDVDEVPAGSPQNDSIPIQTIDSSDDDCRISIASEDSDGSQEEPVAETSSHATKKVGNEKCLIASLFISDDSDESESSDLGEINDVEVITSSPGTSNKNALALDKSHQEELFVIDKTPGLQSSKAYYLEKDLVDEKESEKSKESSELEDSEEEFMDEDEDLLVSNNKIVSFSSSIDPGLNVKQLGGLYIDFDAGKLKSGSHGIVPLKEKKKDELLQKSIITPDFEKKECIPPLKESAYQLKKQRRVEREKTTGDGWFGMKAPEMTEELKNDLQALKMRAAMDPKRFYKKNDRKGLPKYFQVGTIVDSPVDFYHARIPKKERKKNIVEELLADSEFRRYNKRKYQDIMAEKAALAAGKKNLKKKKFRK
ncbi:deoxynucleotidyltransferase terminal-interacting protein 2 [Tiliqua scincoides]|uniref:deoxynucleotidyltransferase terminal-interacting protein 2 n=1 Tax=Tiliqua scincoides TaxID=71010 RepID=UPI0034624DB6